MKNFLLLFLLSTLTISNLHAQNEQQLKVEFKDSFQFFVTDSFLHDLGEIPDTNNKIVKYFKYIGSEPVFIQRTFTGDPHFICRWPREPLMPGQIYSFTVCFWHKHRRGHFKKRMGFILSNNERISFIFKGRVYQSPEED